MADLRKTGRIKKYGVCLNDKCEKYKVVQEIVHGSLECPVCKKKLSNCAPPKKKSSKKPIYIGIATIGLIGAIAGFITLFLDGSSTKPKETIPSDSIACNDSLTNKIKANQDTIVMRDTVFVRDTIVKNNTVTTREKVSTKTIVTTTVPAKSTTSNSTNSTLHLSYGTYTGATKGGYPHGQGRLTYSKSRQINKNDVKGRTANAGDYVIGEFYNGYVVYGKHYDSAGNLLESLNIGIGSENSFESK